MIKLTDAVISKPTFEKKADFELSKDISEWNEEILKNFYEEINFLPKEIGTNVIVKDVDENKGYAKGSIVVFFNGKQINFPVIVKDHKLSPFDIFVQKKGSEDFYYPATEDNIKKSLMANEIGTLENRWDQARGYQLVKSPGGVLPKQSINLYDAPEESIYPPFAKMSRWPFLAKKEDLVKLGESLIGLPDVREAFHDNTGDLITNIVQLKDYQREEVHPTEHRRGIIDLNNVVNAKKAITAIDSEFIDTSKMIPLQPPCVAEMRMYCYPSMEDFLESGSNMAERFIATKIGKPMVGILLDLIDKDKFSDWDSCCAPPSTNSSDSDLAKKKESRIRRDQIFISLDGKNYATFDDYDKTGLGFYGTKILGMPDSTEKAMKMLSITTTDDFINVNKENRNDGSDKRFRGFSELHQGKSDYTGRYLDDDGRYAYGSDGYREGLFVVYGAGTSYECAEFEGNFKKFLVNNSHVYVGHDMVLIPANVASFQKVSSVKDPVYKMIVGKAKHIYLFPESSLIINKAFLKRVSKKDLMRPDLPVQRIFEEQNINKVAMCVMSDGSEIGYRIFGKPFEPISKVANLGNRMLSTAETKAALKIMGMDKTSSDKAMTEALRKYANYEQKDKNVTIYGVNDDYINPNAFAGHEKIARVNSIVKEIAYNLRRNLVKEASMLTDPDAVDVVLSLNFINEESLSNYIENLDKMKGVLADLSQLLIASRMGLSEIDETATKNAITGLSDVIEGLENVKMSVK